MTESRVQGVFPRVCRPRSRRVSGAGRPPSSIPSTGPAVYGPAARAPALAGRSSFTRIVVPQLYYVRFIPVRARAPPALVCYILIITITYCLSSSSI